MLKTGAIICVMIGVNMFADKDSRGERGEFYVVVAA